MKRYLITAAQNNTPTHAGFFAAMQSYAKANDAEIVVVPFRYRNATSKWTEKQAENDFWAEELAPYMQGRYGYMRSGKGARLRIFKPLRRPLGKNLTLMTDVSIQPTAHNPLSGMEVFAGASNVIFGHAKRALQVVPTGTRQPRVMWTTSACTVANYTDTKAGKRGKEHHVIGALVVEVEDNGIFFARHVSANRDGSFTDLAFRYTAEGVSVAPRAASLTLGDYHSGREDEGVLGATERLVELVRPKYILVHDLFDGQARNHHEKSGRARFRARFDTVRVEVTHAVGSLNRVAGWGGGNHKVVVVRSNHDEHLERWAEEFKPNEDPVNVPYWHELRAREFAYQIEHGHFPDLFALEAERLGVSKQVRFLKRNESFRLLGVEGGFHGDFGNGGSRGNTKAYTKLGVKVTKGHDHTPAIMDGVYSVGVTAQLDHGYNKLPSTWMHAHVLLLADGKRQLLIVVDDRTHAGDTK